jgi:hypothetical protein
MVLREIKGEEAGGGQNKLGFGVVRLRCHAQVFDVQYSTGNHEGHWPSS